MNLTGNGDIKDEYLEIITHRHSGPIKRQWHILMIANGTDI